MSTHTAISYHIVFSAKNRTPVLKRERRDDLFRYVWGIIKNRRSIFTVLTVWRITFTF